MAILPLNTLTFNLTNSKIILFDGVCNLCQHSVQFVIRRDPKGIFKFASLQSETGIALQRKFGIDSTNIASFVLIDNGKAYTQSSGALRVVGYLKGGWKLLSVFRLLPSFLRDPFYNFIARNRFKWFGKKEECWVPTPELKNRFLN